MSNIAARSVYDTATGRELPRIQHQHELYPGDDGLTFVESTWSDNNIYRVAYTHIRDVSNTRGRGGSSLNDRTTQFPAYTTAVLVATH